MRTTLLITPGKSIVLLPFNPLFTHIIYYCTSSTKSVPVNFVSRYDTFKQTWAIETSLTRDLFRFSGCTYVNSTFEAIYLFGGQSTYDSVTQSYHIQNSTLLYVPLSVAIANYGRHVHHLNSGEIAGVVIGVTVGGHSRLLDHRLIRWGLLLLQVLLRQARGRARVPGPGSGLKTITK